VVKPTVEAEDTFQRASQGAFWGTASDNEVWQGDANSLAAFSIEQQEGIIAGRGTYVALLGPALHNADILFVGTLSNFQQGTNMGAILRWTDPQHWYKGYIDGTSLCIIKRDGTQTVILGKMPFVSRADVPYEIRFQANNRQFRAKAWAKAGKEPDWMLTGFDQGASWPSGMGGVRVLFQNYAILRVSLFREMSISPP
jgi:hypothetical protein